MQFIQGNYELVVIWCNGIGRWQRLTNGTDWYTTDSTLVISSPILVVVVAVLHFATLLGVEAKKRSKPGCCLVCNRRFLESDDDIALICNKYNQI